MGNTIYKGTFGVLYTVQNAYVYCSTDGGRTWHDSRYGNDLGFFQDGINRGYLVEVKQ